MFDVSALVLYGNDLSVYRYLILIPIYENEGFKVEQRYLEFKLRKFSVV